MTTHAPRTATSGRAAAGAALPVASLGFLLIILDTSAVNVGLNAMGADLGGGMSSLQWVVDGYTLLFGALLLSAGAWSDRIGARRALGIGLAAFTLASVACGLAPTMPALIGARVVQGAAAAALLPSSLALVRQAYDDASSRARAIGIWTASGAGGIALGPVLGGLLTTAWSWRAIFLVNVPVGIIGLLLLARTRPSPRRPAPVDLPGQVLAVVALLALTFGVIEGSRDGILAPPVLLSALVTVLAAAAFFAVEARVRRPMLPVALFRSGAAVTVLLAGFANNAAYYGVVFVLSLYAQRELGQSALSTGLMFVPMSLVVVAVNLLAPRIAARIGTWRTIVAGQLTMAAGMLGLLLIGGPRPMQLASLLLLPLGLGASTAVPLLTAVLLDSVAPEHAGIAAGAFNAARQLGGGLAIAVFGSLAVGLRSFHAGFVASVLLGAGGLLVAVTVTLLGRHRS
ncbi:MFS transporter [Tenggerimyces flavus]|uniref:MFS transporter n=1 Tax=Tenggerimyces flavus TaxID=1708749 RepID=A0ABV7Y667_9ACTN|nr:MFS transporter [Tenggerimyces flavus]MBM7788558.1 DHA2 family methylenomycin A resistance protein-like MFS transporter [Tenggerimyces flavus]